MQSGGLSHIFGCSHGLTNNSRMPARRERNQLWRRGRAKKKDRGEGDSAAGRASQKRRQAKVVRRGRRRVGRQRTQQEDLWGGRARSAPGR